MQAASAGTVDPHIPSSFESGTTTGTFVSEWQGDVLYVQPTKGKAAANDGAALRTYTLITSTLSLLVVVITRL